MHAGLRVIRDEHRTLAAIIDGLVHLVETIEQGRMTPDFALLAAILDYVEAFPDRLHHPKEDLVLFPAVRRRTHDLDQVITELERGHHAGPRILAALRAALDAWRADPARPGPFPTLARDYARHMWDHIECEDTRILARLPALLTEDDWAEIDAAFTSHVDPLVEPGIVADLDALFQRILRVMPAPLGLG